MSKSGIHSLLTLVALSVFLMALVACGDSSTPSEVGTTEDTSPKSTPTSTPADRVPDTSPTSLDGYLATCTGATSGPTEADFTLEEFSAVLEEFTEQLEAVNPPEEVADWHAAVLVYQRAVKEALDDAPGPGEGESQDEYIISVVFPVALQHQPDINEAIKGMDPDLIVRMLEAGCIDEDTLSMSLTPEEMKALGVSPGGTAGGRVITEFASISAGDDHTCGVGTDGAVGCWGGNIFDKATPPDGVFVSVDAGWAHTCGVRTDNALVCWGGGDDDPEPPDGEFTSVSAGHDYTCAVRVDSTVVCWGVDDEGQSTPPAGEFVSVSAGRDHACGVTTDGTVACWGDEGFSNRTTPPVGQFASVSAWNLSCGVRTDGTVACWGGTIGEPEPPDGEFTSVSVGGGHTCGMRADSTVQCWGSDHLEQATPPGGKFVAVSAGQYHTCGVRTDGSAVCWGSDLNGQASPPGRRDLSGDGATAKAWAGFASRNGSRPCRQGKEGRRPTTFRLKLERQKRQRSAMGLMGPWAITKSMVKLRLHNPVGALLAHLLTRSPLGGVKRPGSLSVLAGALLIAVVAMTSCTDGTVRPGEDSPGQTPGPDAALTDAPVLHVPWTRSDLTVETGGYHPIDISMNKEETLEYQFEVTNAGFANPLNSSTTLDVGFLVTDPSGDVVRSIRAHTSGDSITAGASGNYSLAFDNTYALYFHKSIYFDYRVLPKGVKSATPHTPPPSVLPLSPDGVESHRDGTGIVVSWNAAPGADYYRIYYSDYPSPSCELHVSRVFDCERLASKVLETTYTHTGPDEYDNYYWVLACSRIGCSDVDSKNPVAPAYAGPSALPDNIEYRRDGSAIVVSWNEVPDADYYNVYYDDRSSCGLPLSTLDTLGNFSALSTLIDHRSCERLATELVATTYTHTSPDDDGKYYWVVACNNGGCTDIDSDNPATFVDTRPSAPPGNVEYRRDGTVIVVDWNTVPDADYYRIFYHDTFRSSCGLHLGIAIGCDELATNVVDTTYTHTSPVDGDNYYWVAACNGNGCTDTEGEDPATFVDTSPSAPPANVKYRRDGTAIVVSWSGAPDADYYKIYYTKFIGPICKSIRGNLFGCEELATDVVGTTYTHTSPDDDYNHYWVVACNRNGCTDIDSENPATFVDTRPSATIER